jgi:predicted nucleic acid-binding protein
MLIQLTAPTYICLDSAPTSLLSLPARTPEVRAITQWAANCDAAGHTIVVPEIVDYEVRRELIRSGKTASITELNNLKQDFVYLPLTTSAMLMAADLWASVRQQGKPTAADENIDVDVILAAQALTLGVPVNDIVVATVNVRHLSLFLTAEPWTNIVP